MGRITRADCLARDAADPLASFRDCFALPPDAIYLDGNSLGPLPKATIAQLETLVRHEWGEGLIRSWTRHDWISLSRHIGDKIARLIGAQAGEVIVGDSTSVDLFKLLAAALALNPGRTTLLSDHGNFPTDLYVADGLIALLGGRHRLRLASPEDIASAIDADTAVVFLTEVDYRTGRLHDLAALSQAAHDAGALILWDLSHSVGVVPIALGRAGADFAVGCGYKYLNGGSGAPAFLYVALRHQERIRPAIQGWLGHADPFAFEAAYRPAPGIARLLCGTPPILALAALDEGVDLAAKADMAAVREKSIALGDMFIALATQELDGYGFSLASPSDPARRGSHVSLRHANGYPIMQALIGNGVIGDFRAPDILRFGLAPLFIRFADLWDALATLRDIMATGTWDRPAFHARAAVT